VAPGTGNLPIPLLVQSDAGAFAKALTLVSPGKNFLAFGDLLTWEEYVEMRSRVTGVKASFEERPRRNTIRLRRRVTGRIMGGFMLMLWSLGIGVLGMGMWSFRRIWGLRWRLRGLRIIFKGKIGRS
jgi:hypothetical protein